AGEVIYEIYSIYRIAESTIRGDYFLESSGSIDIDFSVDSGSTWNDAWSADSPQQGRQSFSIDLGKSRWNLKKPTTYNMASSPGARNPDGSYNMQYVFYGYRYLVRIRITAQNNADDAGVASLEFKNTHMCNKFMLPALLPGRNIITVEGDSVPRGCAVQVHYEWEEGTGRVKHTSTVACTTLPFTYSINVQESDTMKVKCLFHTISVLDADSLEIVRANPSMKNAPESGVLTACPNPFTRYISIQAAFPAHGEAPLNIYDIKGSLIRSLQADSRGHVRWNGRLANGMRAAPGNYIVNFTAAHRTFSKSITLTP
ncbi:MAG: hypothetical protein ABIA63_08845, partial [bacterium]